MLHFTDTGRDKPVLLFVHGVLMNETVWHKQVAAFKGTHRVITVDMAGFGQSAGSGDEMFPDHVRMINDVLVHLDLTDVTYVGWSMGGAVGQVMGVIAPERLRRIILFATTPQFVADDTFTHALQPEAVGELADVFDADFQMDCAGFGDVCAPSDAETAAFLTDVMTGTVPAIGLASLASDGAQSQLDIMDKISLETHIIHGDEDAVCLPSAAEYLANQVAGCRSTVKWIKGGGHGAHLTHPDAFNGHLRDCLH